MNTKSMHLGPQFPPAWHRPWLRYVEPVEGAEGDNGGDLKSNDGEKTFTQADVNRIVAERVQRAEAKYADYDDLKTKAAGAQTVEQKLAELERKHAEAEARAMRVGIAAQYGISTKKGANGEPSVADLLLTGSDEATLTAQAKALAAAEADRKKSGPVASREGATRTSGDAKSNDMREFTRNLFAAATNE